MRTPPKSGTIRSKIIKGDTVMIRRGKEKGVRGTVKLVLPREGKAMVEGLNLVKRHTKQGAGGAKDAGILEKEAPLPLSALMYVCEKCKAPTRIKYRRTENGSHRVCGRCGEPARDSEKGR
ncbi:MAG TPA: 50S ribosomal protein L24 [Candidatus Baltobacteraceae bacterium]|jgi:large subunit ribosomal protein L24|nr:50S ribosomal protein L24 [Candidatus Baltobacteraceae bacterium]